MGCNWMDQTELPFCTITSLAVWPDCSEPDSISRIRRCNDQVEGTLNGSRCSWFFGVFLDMAMVRKAIVRVQRTQWTLGVYMSRGEKQALKAPELWEYELGL